MSDEGLAHRVRRLEDLEALRSLKYTYATRTDRCVADVCQASVTAVAELFTEDATANYGQFGSYQGREAIAGFFREVLPSVTSWTRHYMHNPVLEVDGETATGDWYSIALSVMKAAPDAGVQSLYVRYEDRYRKTAAGWRIAATMVHFDQPG